MEKGEWEATGIFPARQASSADENPLGQRTQLKAEATLAAHPETFINTHHATLFANVNKRVRWLENQQCSAQPRPSASCENGHDTRFPRVYSPLGPDRRSEFHGKFTVGKWPFLEILFWNFYRVRKKKKIFATLFWKTVGGSA